MRLSSICFLLGVCAVLFFPTLPSSGELAFFVVLTFVLALMHRFFRPVLCIIFGLVWVLLNLHYYDHSLEVGKFQYKKVKITGIVSSIPMIQNKVEKFHFQVEGVNGNPVNLLLKLAWYDDFKQVNVGQRWVFEVKLKKPRGFANPGSIDVEKMSVAKHVNATGYITKTKTATHMGQTGKFPVLQFREYANDFLKERLSSTKHGDIMRALTLGVRDDISQQDWRLFRVTGTSHLMSISGLHVGLIAGAAYALLTWLFKLSSFLCLRVPACRFATVGTLLIALIYSILTGFGVPEQRALVMLFVFMLSSGWGVNLSKWTAYCLSLWIVLLINPLTVMLPGFWLSFVAVAIMILMISSKTAHWLIKWMRIQWGLTIGLFPLCLLFFGQVSLVSPIVNLFAVPVLGFVVVPLSFLGVISSLLFPVFSNYIFQLSEAVIEMLWIALQFFSGMPFASMFVSVNTGWVFGLLIASSAGMLLSKRSWQKVIFSLGLLVLFVPVSPVAQGRVDFSLLDVGQGLSTVVRTAHHVLVFDTGPFFGGAFNAGDAVLIPFLRHFNIRNVATVVLSHGHVDHTGGARALLQAFNVERVLTSIPRYRSNAIVSHCYAGQRWVWDDVVFDVIYPPKRSRYVVNNSSCVMRITSKDKTFLLTGDIEKEAESYLVKHNVNLKADVLVAPHHGSHTSSSQQFLEAVSPSVVLFSTGYRNHYHFPHPTVSKRYQAMGVLMLNTAIVGEIDIAEGITLYRNAHQHWWSR